MLQEPDSAGIPCLLAASSPSFYLDESSELRLPPSCLEFDLHVEVRQNDGSQGDSCVSIDVGEVKSSFELGTAITQLGVRLNALKWCVRVCMDVPEEHLQLKGRLFLPHTGQLDGGDKKQAARLAREWGFLLFVMEL